MRTYKAITSIPGIVDLGEDYRTDYEIKTGSQAYSLVSTLYRGVRLRCDSLSRVPVTITGPGGGEKDWPFPGISPKTFLWKTEAGLLIYAASYWLKRVNQRDRMGRAVRDLQYLNPSTVTVKVKENGEIWFEQNIGEEDYGPWPQEQMVYLAEWDPEQDLLPGVAPVQVALADAGLLHYMSTFASLFFKSGAMPITLVGLERPVNESEREKAERKISRMISGLANAFRVRLLNSPVTPITLTPPISDLAMPELDAKARRSVANALGIPVTMLEDAANYATAEGHRLSFWQDTVRPHGEWIQEEVNRQLFNPMGLEMALQWEEMEVFQADEAERADSLTKLVGAGVPLDLSMEILGYDLTEEQWNKIKEKLEEKDALTEALVSAAGSQEETPPPDQEEQSKRIQEWPRPTGTLDEVREELVKYQKKALDALKRGRGPAVIWNSEYIPDPVRSYIHLGLAGALTEEEVRSVFDAAFGWVKYGT